MDWMCLKTTFERGLVLSPIIQQAWYAAYLQHVGSHGYLWEVGVFQRGGAASGVQEFYFTPQAVALLEFLIVPLGAQRCAKPARRLPDEHRWEGLGMLCGEAKAWELLDPDTGVDRR